MNKCKKKGEIFVIYFYQLSDKLGFRHRLLKSIVIRYNQHHLAGQQFGDFLLVAGRLALLHPLEYTAPDVSALHWRHSSCWRRRRTWARHYWQSLHIHTNVSTCVKPGSMQKEGVVFASGHKRLIIIMTQ